MFGFAPVGIGWEPVRGAMDPRAKTSYRLMAPTPYPVRKRLKSTAGKPQSVQTTTCAICGRADVFTTVNSVVRAVVCGDVKATPKDGSSSVGAGAPGAMSHVSSFGVTPAKADPATRRTIT